MGLNPEALSALESLRQQLVADGHPDEREPESPPEEHQKAKTKKARPKRAKQPKKAHQEEQRKTAKPAAEPEPTDSQQKPKRRVGKDGKVYPTATQKRRARRKRALEREQLESSAPKTA